MMGRKIIKGLSIALSVLIYLFSWLSPSFAGESPWPLFQAAINAANNNITPTPPSLPPGTVISAGQIWMDRNLGASRVATSSTDSAAYGDLFQWGRGTDGHEKRTSPTTRTLSTTDIPGHGNFILKSSFPYDWRTPQNDNLWRGVSGTNNPCPPGFRVPTEAEFLAEILSWSSYDSAGAFASPLKLGLAGFRRIDSGTISSAGIIANYWSSTVTDDFSCLVYIVIPLAGIESYGDRGNGYSVRCIKD